MKRRLAAALLFLISIFLLWSALGHFITMGFRRSGPSWHSIAASKREELISKIPKEWILSKEVIDEAKSRRSIAGDYIESLLDSDTVAITSLEPTLLADRIAKGELTAVNVVKAFCKRASYIHQLNPALLEIGFDLALERAKELDAYFKEHKKPVGPLHGLPVTLKDQFHIKGLETSFAYVGWIGTFEGARGTGKEKNVESELIRELNSLGAVPIGKTSLVQSTWAPETNNNIIGYTWSPFNQKLSAGGSSGGEGVMQALRGSAVGFGTDSGGSVTMPAAYNGVYSIKPSTGRISFKDAVGSSLGNRAIVAVTGLLGPSVATVRLVFKSLLETKPWLYDPLVLPLPWRPEEEVDPDGEIALGFMRHDGLVAPHPPIARAMQTAYDALRAKGIKLIEWDPPSHGINDVLHSGLARGDGCADAWEAIKLSGEPIVPEIEEEFPGGKLVSPMPLLEYQNLTRVMDRYRIEYNDYWRASANRTGTGRPVDAVILPVSPYAGVIPKKFFTATYTSIVNVLDYCSAVVPVSFADKSIDVYDPHYKPLTREDEENVKIYDAELIHGVPTAIQVMGQNWSEEKLLSVAQIVSDALKHHKA